MSEGRWTPSSHVEREAATLRRRLRWEGNLNVWFAGASLSVSFVTGLLALGRWSRFGPSWVEIAVLALLSLAAGGVAVWLAFSDSALKQRTKEADRERRGELGHGVGWLVDLIVLQGDAPTGSDRGMLWFEDGRLCFSGDRTSFALARGQVFASERVGGVPGLRHALRLPLDHRTAAGPLVLSLRGERDESIVKAVDRWEAPSGALKGQLPPTEIGPGAPSSGRLLFGASLVTLLWMVTVGALGLVLVGGLSFLSLCVAFGTVWGMATRPALSPFLRWGAFRHRQKLNQLGAGRGL